MLKLKGKEIVPTTRLVLTDLYDFMIYSIDIYPLIFMLLFKLQLYIWRLQEYDASSN